MAGMNDPLLHAPRRNPRGSVTGALSREVRFAARSLRRTPGFTLTAVLTLALGIGLTTTMFSVVDGVVLRPLPFPDADRLVTLCEQYPGSTRDWCSVSPPNVADIADGAQALAAVGIGRGWSAHLATPEGAVVLPAGIASPGMFRAMAVPPAMGRTLEPADLTGTAGHVAVITHEMWQTRFGGDPGIIGRAITLDREPVTIVGVMPPGFRVPKFEWVELWRPLHIDPRSEEHRAWRGFVAYARLRPGVSLQQAQADLARLTPVLRREHFAATPQWDITMTSLHDLVVGGVRPTMLLFLGAVGLVLLVACANVANLLLARGTVRRRELAVRTALGAGAGRLMRGLLLESLLLSIGGAVVGVLLALGGTAAFRALAPSQIPRVAEVGVDLRMLGFALALAVATTLLFGLLPAVRATRASAAVGLRDGGRTHTGRGRLGSALVVAELALALVLLTGAGLLTRTFAALSSWSPGFDQTHVLVFSSSASSGSYRTADAVSTLWIRASDALETIPGVAAVGTASGGPVFGGRETAEALAPGGLAREGESVRWFDVSPGFFAAMGIPIIRGRDLDARDVTNSEPAILVNETLARRYWPDDDPVGRRLDLVEGEDTTAFAVLGVVRDVPALRPGTPTEAQIYWSNRQRPRWFTYFIVRTTVPPASIVPAIRAQLASVDADLSPSTPRTIAELVTDELVDPRFFMLLLATFGVAALALAAIGTYGLLAYLVSQRQRDIGIRLALGAWHGQVIREVLRQGARLALAGLVIGASLSFAFGRVLRNLVAGISTHDPVAMAAAMVTLTLAVLVSCVAPAWRASRVSPMIAMRAD